MLAVHRVNGVRNRMCPHCAMRFESHADVGHCVACGYPTTPTHAARTLRTYTGLFVFVNGVPLVEERAS